MINTQVDNTKELDVVRQMHNLIEFFDNFLQTSENLCQYYIGGPGEADDAAITRF